MTDEQIVDRILRLEGGYVDDPLDKGRCTNRGITLNTLRDWRGHPVTCQDVQTLTEQETREIYHARYVKPFDGLDDGIKPQVVDIAVLSGRLTARALLALAMQDDQHDLNTALVIQRLKHFATLCAEDPSRTHFLRGWINRAASFL